MVRAKQKERKRCDESRQSVKEGEERQEYAREIKNGESQVDKDSLCF